ncbi:MAG TPA: energy transducer TonB, partial [Longimicrobiales bacterium]|nr:energy transducer TonB [Longimicrobiales bacterium]
TSSRRSEPDGETGRADEGRAPLSRLTLDELRRGATLRATVVAPEPEPDDGDEIVFERRAADDNGPHVGGDASLGAHDEAADSLGLYRLSSLRPELAFAAPGSWILVRNPSAVRRFLLKRFGQAGLDSTPRGWLSVAIWVDETGSVEWAEIDRSSGIPEMDATALELFREVVSFRPARERGVPVSIAAIFQLRYPW